MKQGALQISNELISSRHAIPKETDELKTEWDSATQNKERIKDEIGDILFLAANLATKASITPETALINTNNKYECRFGYLEDNLQKRQIPIDSAGLQKWTDSGMRLNSKKN